MRCLLGTSYNKNYRERADKPYVLLIYKLIKAYNFIDLVLSWKVESEPIKYNFDKIWFVPRISENIHIYIYSCFHTFQSHCATWFRSYNSKNLSSHKDCIVG